MGVFTQREQTDQTKESPMACKCAELAAKLSLSKGQLMTMLTNPELMNQAKIANIMDQLAQLEAELLAAAEHGE